MTRMRVALIIVVLVSVTAAGMALAQRGRNRGFRGEPPLDRAGVPDWPVDKHFPDDVFTFVRIEYDSSYGYGRGGGKWATDYPDSDYNFSYRLQELTSLKVNPNPVILRLTDPKLFDYPFLYMIEPGDISLSSEEVLALRKYLYNGGFMMVDDFWGEREWNNFYQQIKEVFPDREPQELPLEHAIFNTVYPLSEKPQVPSIHAWFGGYTYERPDAREAHYRGIFDDKGRMMAIICHNTDLGDGWEREGVDSGYFHEFSEKWSYPMGINIVVYAMTH